MVNFPDGGLIERQVLREQVKRFLLDAIRRGDLRGGDRVVETQVARRLGVSQAPVREAIRELEQMGVLESEPFRGAVVKQLSDKELRDIYSVRAVLEAMAAREAVARLSAADVAQLTALVDEMVEAARRGDSERMVAFNTAFHEQIVKASGNGFLARLWQMMHPGYWTAVTTAASPRGLEELARRHYEVVEALRSGDPEQAAQAMERHIAELREDVSQQVEPR